jgi:hypothetical protein
MNYNKLCGKFKMLHFCDGHDHRFGHSSKQDPGIFGYKTIISIVFLRVFYHCVVSIVMQKKT